MIFCGLVGIALVYYLAPAVEQHWRWVTPGSVVALALWLAMSWGLRVYVARFGDYNATYGSIAGIMLLMLWLYLTGIVLVVGAEINAEIEHAAALHGALTAKAPGEHRPAAAEEPEDGWFPPGRTAAENITIAKRLVERWLGEAQRRGWGPFTLVGTGVVAGWLIRGLKVSEVARVGGQVAKATLQVAAAVAAIQWLREHQGSARQGATEDETSKREPRAA